MLLLRYNVYNIPFVYYRTQEETYLPNEMTFITEASCLTMEVNSLYDVVQLY